MLSIRAFISWHREFKNVSIHHCPFSQLANYSGGGAGLIPSHHACTTT